MTSSSQKFRHTACSRYHIASRQPWNGRTKQVTNSVFRLSVIHIQKVSLEKTKNKKQEAVGDRHIEARHRHIEARPCSGLTADTGDANSGDSSLPASLEPQPKHQRRSYFV